MNTFRLLITIILSFPFLVSAAPKKSKKEKTWMDVSIEAKLSLRENLAKAGMPVISPVVRSFEKATVMSANVKGQEQLVLIVSGGPDGTSDDWSTFVNARLIKEDGSVVWLDELDPVYQRTGAKRAFKNETMYGDPLIVGGKKYDHGIFCHANAVLI